MSRNIDLNSLYYSLKVVEKESSIESLESMVAFVTGKLRNVNVDTVAEADRKFVLAKHLIHYTLLDSFLEPIGLVAPAVVPPQVQDTTREPFIYRAKGYNYEIAVDVMRRVGGYIFILVNTNTMKCSRGIDITDEDVLHFLNDSSLDVVRRSEIAYKMLVIILTFLRGKSPGTSVPGTPVADPLQIDPFNPLLYV